MLQTVKNLIQLIISEKFTKPIEELNDMIEKDHGCHAVCNFCNKEYNFTEEELIAIRDSIKK